MGMSLIQTNEARALVEGGIAGWYAVNANPPIIHNACYVVSLLDGRHFLVGKDDLSVEQAGLTRVNRIPKQIHGVKFDGDSEIGKLLVKDMETAKRNHPAETTFVAMCENLPLAQVTYAGRRRGP